MERLFAIDGKLFTIFSRIADLVVLNLLWFLCCVPVVTIGASIVALYTVTLKMVRNEDTYIVGSFFRAFIENFKQATLFWCGALVVTAVLYCDFYFVGHAAWVGILFFVPLVIIAFLLAAVMSYVFPILAYFKNSTKNVLRNAALMAVAYLPYTFGILCVNLLPVAIFFLGNPVIAGYGDVILGGALPAFLNAYLFKKMFGKIQSKHA
ncbi:MAG: YesL family protein [Oliverpabstia sp.]